MKYLKLNTLLIITFLLVFLNTAINAQVAKSYVNTNFTNKAALQIQYKNDSLFTGSLVIMKKHSSIVDKTTDFTGLKTDGSFHVKFNQKPPVLNENMKWTKFSWRIISVDRIDTIIIRFMQKDLNSKEWIETEYEFIEEIE